ncbi:integral membrane protein S linking to the trans Golgi network-domain-containing protein [Suillus clintonianus]|uniref:integral membrane protein S linking to the trans Golgi network-domain-containing protein n=1 Tax=Suillus clintonianus TaxID=1904413 RepID=UPI001B86604A|nr:integral membrane protein S linking to the trans Golgi network-domain-containing protein [Suillus clintonianus]KAG2144292.1 integral membrane protein S linking to the trans Golgi network-domain-containing protein [Suillus clintonianus]
MAASSRASNASWDPILLISQIVSLQTLHYLTLSVLIPPLLSIFAETGALVFEGGATNVGMIIDWREMAGRPTVRGMQGEDRWNTYYGAWSGGKQLGSGWEEGRWDGWTDPMRGWVIAFSWMIASFADIYYLCVLVRRPRLILDFALTLAFSHLVLTTYYSASIPTSLFFWLVIFAWSATTVIIAEQLCVKREMAEGLIISPPRDEVDDVEMGELLRRD